jgi:hypothetical protein
MLLLCSTLTVACVVGYFLKDYIGRLVEIVAERILDAALELAFP